MRLIKKIVITLLVSLVIINIAGHKFSESNDKGIGKVVNGINEFIDTGVKSTLNEIKDTEVAKKVTGYVENVVDKIKEIDIENTINDIKDATVVKEVSEYISGLEIGKKINELTGMDIVNTDN
ncbi:hypothetical protein [[Clostridium] dakarense]|uniref:hypothetical protein n=1 Tax=Faecalimicrobium dakarense TaxID=1301100 RepID=UPI0004AFA143|nr:hypothetical protein [[Clostridium] dakarense]